jgi:hypothetical protein
LLSNRKTKFHRKHGMTDTRSVEVVMKGFFPALLGGLLAGIGAWVVQSFGGSHWVPAVSTAIGGFIGVAIAQALT